MKTTKLVIGIISIVLFFLISFQSCAVGVGNSLAENGEVSGTAGVMLAFCMLIAGIVGIATRKGIGGGFVSGGFYFFGGLMGIANYGSYSDLKIWSVLSFIFAAIFIVGTIFTKKNKPDDKE
ncbi:MAG: hypothetical protein IJA32_05100 [Lachnospiraceae bacterium]|nr:hypothetical protein [Lachnospiraceae bacterium]